MNKQKLLGLGLGLGLVLNGLGVNNANAMVHTPNTEDLKNDSTVVYGSGLKNSPDKQKVAQALGVKGGETEGYVTSADVLKSTGKQFEDAVLFSSLKVDKGDKGSGVDVVIDETNGKITDYTEEMYENALISTGFEDVKVTVASNNTVTGDSAYGGIGKVAELNGIKLDENITKTVQEELTTVSGINKELDGKDGYSQEQLNKAVAEAKSEIAQKDGKLSDEQVKEVVNKSLENNGLNGVLSDNQVNLIVNYMVNAQEKGLFSGDNADKVIEGTKGLVKNITESDEFKQASEKAKDLGKDIKDSLVKEGVWDKFVNFIKSIVDAIMGIFK